MRRGGGGEEGEEMRGEEKRRGRRGEGEEGRRGGGGEEIHGALHADGMYYLLKEGVKCFNSNLPGLPVMVTAPCDEVLVQLLRSKYNDGC